jgi:hypothetical protein
MRRDIRAIAARLRERDRLRDELGLNDLSQRMEVIVDAIVQAEDFFNESSDETPNIVAARLMIGLTNDCQQDEIAAGNGYSGRWLWLLWLYVACSRTCPV